MAKTDLMRKGRRMAYLNKCVKVQILIAEYENETTIRKQVFEKHIRPVLMCSYASFNRMLNEKNPQKQIEELIN